MVLQDLMPSVVTNKIELNQRDFHSFPAFQRAMDRRGYHHFYLAEI